METTPKYPRYQDYVFRDGQVVGEFDAMYKDFENPWRQDRIEEFASDKAICINLLRRARHAFGSTRVVEMGCGLGYFTRRIAAEGFETLGIDISPTACAKAAALHPQARYVAGDFSDVHLLREFRPHVIVMAEVTWYVLDRLRGFLDFLRAELPDTLLFHALSLYRRDEQKVGVDYFSTDDDIRRWFGMNYLEWGAINHSTGQSRAYFLGTWNADKAPAWEF